MSSTSTQSSRKTHDVVIVGGGGAGIATAASLLKRRPDLDILVVEPQTKHYYQPGWTMVGAGIFRAASTERDEEGVIPRRARWLKAAVAAFAPQTNEVILKNGERIAYRALVAAKETIERSFDMIHVCPPQLAPDFVRSSPLADKAGWIEVNQDTQQNTRFANGFGLGDACSAPNAKTAAAARKQAPIVAENLLCVLAGKAPHCAYDGYGSCPLTVERGKIVFAEFGYGGKLLPTFPKWLIDGTRPQCLPWLLKARILPPLYWGAMLKGREWLARPSIGSAKPHT
jgi:NADPH-dependent 2,4-dienoyl-CoA reductase/sulfur reductase-like enzyme